MSVVKSKRTESSSTEFFIKALDINDRITKYLINDFGMPNIAGNYKIFTERVNMEIEDAETMKNLVNKYGIKVEADVKYWLLEYYRERILNICSKAIDDITDAYSIFPNTVDEYSMKRRFINQSISDYHKLKHTFQTSIRNLPINLEKYAPFVKEIDDEIERLKAWRKDNNKYKKSCYFNDEKEIIAADEKVLKTAVKVARKYKNDNLGVKMIVNPDKANAFLNRIFALTSNTPGIVYNPNTDKDIMDYAYNNYKNNTYVMSRDENGLPKSDVVIPAVVKCDEEGNITGPIYGFESEFQLTNK